MTAPHVTIAIPTFQRLHYLQQAIASAEQQTYASFEIVISDNCSTDGTAEYLQTLGGNSRIRVLQQTTNLGMVGNWNACLHAAAGEWFLLLSDDDYLEPEALTRMLAALAQSAAPEDVGVVYCRCRTVDSDGRELASAPEAPLQESVESFALAFFRRRRVLFPCGVLLRTADLREFGGFRADGIALGCDALAWSEAALKRGQLVCAPGLLANYRVHLSNLTSTGQISHWTHDLAVLIDLWKSAFSNKPAALQRQLDHASARYYTYFLATVLATGGHGLRGRWRGLKRFFAHRALFLSAAGAQALLFGLGRLLAPRWLEDLLRRLRAAAPKAASAGAG